MIRKLIIAGLLLWAAVFFYKKFMANTTDLFFKNNAGNVDVLQQKIPDYKVE